MEEIKKAKNFIKDMLSSDIKLSRSKGISLYLSNLLKPYISKSLYENLKLIDNLSIQKKKAILEETIQELDKYSITNKPITTTNYTTNLEYNTQQIVKNNLRHIKDLNISIQDMPFLSKNQKQILSLSGLNTLVDVLWYFPYSYENRIPFKSIVSMPIDQYGTLKLRIESFVFDEKDMYPFSIIAKDEYGIIGLKFKIKDKSVLNWYHKGQIIYVYGRLKEYHGKKYMVHPKIFPNNSKDINIIKAVYPLSRNTAETIDSNTPKRRKILEQAINNILDYYKDYWKNLQEILPEEFIIKYNLIDLSWAFKIIHTQKHFDSYKEFEEEFEKAKKRFLYEEMFIFELAMYNRRIGIKSHNAPIIKSDEEEIIKEIENKIHFSLTNAQKRTIREIIKDINTNKPMSRLLQGDVGSGKTMVAIGTSLAVVKNGYQVAIMVPTEILANQHYKNFESFFSKIGYKVGLLTSSTSKTDIHKLISENYFNIVIGTHALIQEKVNFNNLGLVIIDEQHRFGVAQRQALLEKSQQIPHMLYMSATPIPRTIAMGIFGDLDISVLDEMPANRKHIKTSILYLDRQKDMDFLINHIKKEIQNGRKIYIVYPLIEESEKLDIKAAQTEYEKWKNIFKDYEVLLLHGKMNDSQKQEIMEAFKEKAHILVSTTVIEVGVDVPQASTIVIEDAHRFGLSQLHQLRGRVGRGDTEGYCFLTTKSDFIKNQILTEQNQTLKRFRIMVSTNDGFKISLEDLKLRGPGDVLGLSQTGYFNFNIVDLKNEEHLTQMAKIREELKNYKQINQDLIWLVERKYLKEKASTISSIV